MIMYRGRGFRFYLLTFIYSEDVIMRFMGMGERMEKESEHKKSNLDFIGKSAYIPHPMKNRIIVLHKKLIHYLKRFWLWFLPVLGAGMIFFGVFMPIVYIWTQMLIDKNYDLNLFLCVIVMSFFSFYLGRALREVTEDKHFLEMSNPDLLREREKTHRVEEYLALQKKIEEDYLLKKAQEKEKAKQGEDANIRKRVE